MARVLVVDDDQALARALRVALKVGGHEVKAVVTGQEGLDEMARGWPEVVVLDLGLPDISGIEVCRRARAWSDVPIVVLSAIGTEDRKVEALDGGADDYMTKPFGMGELEARIRTALRHRAATHGSAGVPSLLTVGRLQIDMVHHQASVGGDILDLTAKEFEILAFLARHSGKVCTHQMVLSAVWGPGYGDEAQYLHAYVHRLRQKLGAASGTVIKTKPGIGYNLQPAPGCR